MNGIEFIIKLKDGGVVKVDSDNSYIRGCPTCDYGAEYCNTLWLDLVNINITIWTKNSNDYDLSLAKVIKLFAYDFSNMTELEFAKYLNENVCEMCDGEIEFKITDKKGEEINVGC